jgi:hypothetical protein
MKDNSTSIKSWQIYLGIIGSLLWFFILEILGYFQNSELFHFYNVISGYTIGFIVAFSGWIFWETLQGRGKKFIVEGALNKWLISVPLLIIFFIGLLGFYKSIWGSSIWSYNLGSFMGGIALTFGLAPLLEVISAEK